MVKSQPTWRNQRIGDAYLARCLDRFLIKDPLVRILSLYKQWVGCGGILYHSPIFMELSSLIWMPKAPFKFNSTWLKDPSYIHLVNNYWLSHPPSSRRTLEKGFCDNLLEIKWLSIDWAKEKWDRDEQTLRSIELNLDNLLDEQGLGFTSEATKSHLLELEAQWSKILKEREETWHLRSWAIWLQASDENTKFFQNYVKGRKVCNTIWRMPMEDGSLDSSFNQLAHLGNTHFQNMFHPPPLVPPLLISFE